MHTWGQGKLFTKKMNLQGELSVVFPKFRREKCIGCGRCVISCADGGHQAIRLSDDRKPILDGKNASAAIFAYSSAPNVQLFPATDGSAGLRNLISY